MTNVERVGTGHPSRRVGKRPDGFSQYFQTHHRGKRSIAVNLREPVGRERGRRGDVAERDRPGPADPIGGCARSGSNGRYDLRLRDRSSGARTNR